MFAKKFEYQNICKTKLEQKAKYDENKMKTGKI